MGSIDKSENTKEQNVVVTATFVSIIGISVSYLSLTAIVWLEGLKSPHNKLCSVDYVEILIPVALICFLTTCLLIWRKPKYPKNSSEERWSCCNE